MQLLLECIKSSDAFVSQASLLALNDCYKIFGDALLPYTSRDQHNSKNNILAVLFNKACSPLEPKDTSKRADAVLTTIAEELHQQSVLHLLEPFAMQWDKLKIRSKAASLVIRATYRLQ